MDIFEGQPLENPDFSVIHQEQDIGLFRGQLRTELGVGNRLTLSDDQLKSNVRSIQDRNDIDNPGDLPLEAWPILGSEGELIRQAPHFSVEMETGTGKTYVYLRTIFELSQPLRVPEVHHRRPSVAIREGVLKNIEITAEHFRALYNNHPSNTSSTTRRRLIKLRQFATSNTITDPGHQHRRLPQELHGY